MAIIFFILIVINDNSEEIVYKNKCDIKND